MNKCGCNKTQKAGELWMQGHCNKCGSEIEACSWNCSLEICQNCKRNQKLEELGIYDINQIVDNHES